MDNQLMAQVLMQHGLASREQMEALWPYVSETRDIGSLLVHQGLLDQVVYGQLLDYLTRRAVPSEAPATRFNGEMPPAAGISSTRPAPVAAGTAGAVSDAYDAAPGEDQSPAKSFWQGKDRGRAPLEEEPPEAMEALPADLDWEAVEVEEAALTAGAVGPTAAARGGPMAGTAGADAAGADGPRGGMPGGPPGEQDAQTRSGNSPPAGHSGLSGPSPGPPLPSVPGSFVQDGLPALPAEFRGDAGHGPPRFAVPHSLTADSSFEQMLAFARACDATDVHLSSDRPVLLRHFGELKPATSAPVPAARVEALVASALAPEGLAAFRVRGDLECVIALPGAGRFRVTVMRHAGGMDCTARLIPIAIRAFEESGLPEACLELTRWATGLVLVTGPAGCGKTSTLSTLVEQINRTRQEHIITVESPVEIVFDPKCCQVTQRELGLHSLSREKALKAALREDPDIMVISELRDLEGIQMAVTAAETGHLVFATMNTTNASRTVYRLVDSFPAEEQPVIRNMVSESLRGIISQQLIPRADGAGLVPAYEVLLVNSAVANLIRKDETHQLGTAMMTGKSAGMVLLDDSLRRLVEQGFIVPEEARRRAANPKDFDRYIRKG